MKEVHGIRFLKRHHGDNWVEVGAKEVHNKVGHALRDLDAREEDRTRDRIKKSAQGRARDRMKHTTQVAKGTTTLVEPEQNDLTECSPY